MDIARGLHFLHSLKARRTINKIGLLNLLNLRTYIFAGCRSVSKYKRSRPMRRWCTAT